MAVAPWAHAQTTRPNVILILVDDLGAVDLACYGSRFHRTPHLDRLAADGMRFTSAYAACPVCSPTRAAVMTGKYPARLHITDWIPGQPDRPVHRLLRPAFRQELPLEEITLAERLHQAGYATATIGKWHLGGDGFEPTRQGFDLNIGGDASGSPKSYFPPFAREGFTMPGLADAPPGEYLTDRLFDEAVHFLSAQREHPFFLYLPLYAVHTPLMAPQPAVDSFQDVPPHGQQRNPVYAAMLECVDTGVGRLIATLDQLQLSPNTIVLFTSDNGGLATTEGNRTPATNNAPLREGKGYLYEGGIRVPLLVKWPGHVAAGSQCDAPVSSIDLAPTIAAACNVSVEDALDGVSLLPLLEQKGELVRDALYWHYPHYSNQGGQPGGAIRRGDFKLIEFYERGRRELFNLRQDPSENVNLAEKQPQLVAELALLLATWREQVGAQSMTPNLDYHPNPQQSDGSIQLLAKTADVQGVMLRYEPLPHKNTLGFWTRADDWASWEFEVTQPGTFQVSVLQGCGPGSGGSEVELTVGDQTLRFTVQETKGFQDFIERDLGRINIAQPGRHTLTIKPLTKPGPAVMDLRSLKLTPVSPSETTK
jgi:arylsulfatase A-like enzyme